MAGDAEQSLLWQAISGNQDDVEMPPDGPLKTNENNVLKQWISDGPDWAAAKLSARACRNRSIRLSVVWAMPAEISS